MFKLVALDLDGTLLNSNKNISIDDLKYLRKLIDAGIIVVIATGRRYYAAKELTKKIDGELLFLDVISLTRKFRFSMKNEELTITLDIVGLDKHFIYYLIDMLDILKKSIK